MTTKYTEIDIDPYVPFPADQLAEDSLLPFDVFIKDKSVVMPLFYAGTIFTGAAKTVLQEKGIREVYARVMDRELLEVYLSRRTPGNEVVPTEQEFRQYCVDKEQHFLIDKSLLVPGTSVPFSLFFKDGYTLQRILDASEQAPGVVESVLLPERGEILVKVEDLSRYRAYLNSLLSAKKGDGESTIRAVAIRENSKLILKELLDEPRSGEKIKESITQVSGMVDSILDNRDAIRDLLSLSTYDYYTYTHSVNVAVLSVGLAIALGLPRDQIERLGIGAMLHDVGKSSIPHEILNKPGKLDDREYGIMKTHVTEGEKLLRIHREIPAESFNAVTEHHERLSGRGYPSSKSGGTLSLFGRLTSIVDCYDALTTRRPYQQASTPFYAISIINRVPGEYDLEILKVFIRMLGEVKK